MEYSTNKNRSSQVSNLDQSNDKDFGSSKQSKKHSSADVTNLINTNLTRETFQNDSRLIRASMISEANST